MLRNSLYLSLFSDFRLDPDPHKTNTNQKHQFNKYGYENLLKKSNLLGKKKNFDMKNNETKNKSSQKLQIQEIEWKER